MDPQSKVNHTILDERGLRSLSFLIFREGLVRIFAAIELEKELKEEILSLRNHMPAGNFELRWASKQQVHLTLKFLGEITSARLDEVLSAFLAAASTISPFIISLGKCGCFPERGAVRIVWAGIQNQDGALAGCQSVMEREFVRIGFEREEREFKPHITVARVKRDSSGGSLRECIEKAELALLSQRVNRVSLLESKLKPSGAEYSLIERVPLGCSA